MIRINLLPHREIKRAARRRQFNYLLAASLALAVGVIGLGQAAIQKNSMLGWVTSSQEAPWSKRVVSETTLRSRTRGLARPI